MKNFGRKEMIIDVGDDFEVGQKDRLPKPEEFISILEGMDLPEHAKVYRKVVELAKEVREAGGRALLVGGCVRDMMIGKIPKDFDIEIYRLSPPQIERLARELGKISEVGKAFGIIKLSISPGVDIDLSLPRKDSKVGSGHTDFEVEVDRNMSITDAARRRDFTINSMAADPLTGELFDPFGGERDLRERVLRVTDPELFRDDSLRVMRALQFVARLGLSIDQETAKIIMSMVPELKHLPKERIFEEWKKLLKSEKPSLGLVAGMALGVFKEIHPEFPPMAETAQEPEWHPEGDAWIHTLMSLDEAAKIIRRERLSEDSALVILFAALCHDLGKPIVTKFDEGRIRSHGHEAAGEEPTKKFLAALGAPSELREKVVRLVIEHLIPTHLYTAEVINGNKISDGSIRRLATRISPATIYELVLVAEADHLGRGPFADPEIPEQLLYPSIFPQGEWLLKKARSIDVEKSKPVNLIEGRDLISLGFKPGVHVGEIIRLANNLRDDKEFTKEMVLRIVFGAGANPKEAIAKLKAALES